ncbi:MAG: ABC transporter ATP-binding protein [Actinomycetota bacterium]|nr:ABC transporter ATP-binding protein [Actinomycetota bacterium]
MPPLVEATDVHRTYPLDGVVVQALRGVSFTIQAGEYVAVLGPSGSGKSTLLHLLGALDRPTAGTIRFDGRDLRSLSDSQLAEVRNRRIGLVFQSFHLLPRLTALGNVALPLVYRGVAQRERRRRALEALDAVGVADRAGHRPTQLSGGQQQRVAIARAIVGSPALLLADEPTGNLDTATGGEVLRLLARLHAQAGTALVVVTHDERIAAGAERRIEVRDGLLAEQTAPRARGGHPRTPGPGSR